LDWSGFGGLISSSVYELTEALKYTSVKNVGEGTMAIANLHVDCYEIGNDKGLNAF
jgi:hypothetical protein